jgi:hypothetical protein
MNTTYSTAHALGSNASHEARSHAHHCAACGQEAIAPSLLWRVLAIAFWVPMLAFGACCALLLPFNLILVPCWVAVASAVGPLARKASERRCGCRSSV